MARSVANEVIGVGRRKKATRKELLAAGVTGLVESNFRNLKYGHADSEGWRQERRKYYKNPTNVQASAERFFDELKAHRGKGLSVGELAQAVQRSAFPDRYQKRLKEARKIVGGVSSKRTDRKESRAAPSDNSKEKALAYLASRQSGRGSGSFLREVAAMKESPDRDVPDKVKSKRSGKGKIGSKKATLREIATQAQKMGLHVGENPHYGGVAPVHTKGSFHYSGRAIDVSGADPATRKRFNKWVARKYGKNVKELFHDPGVNIDNGKKTRPIGGHGSHVHVAI